MIAIGKVNHLKIVKEVPFGVYLQGGGAWGEILLPKKWVPKGAQINDTLKVFLYFDSDDKLIATTLTPFAEVGDFALLKVIDVNPFGAFLDWGLEKDLLCPRSEQQRSMEKNKSYLVYLKQDNQDRIVASAKLDYFLDKSPAHYKPGEEVRLWVAETTAMGAKVIINDSHWGLIHSADIFQGLSYGKKMQGYIKTVREDGKIDVVIRKIGRDRIQELAQRILTALENADGFLALHDKSPAEEIERKFGESKKGFKAAIGYLYKQGDIQIEPDGIRLSKKRL